MAIDRSAGTEIIRCSAHYDVDEDTPLIIGVQHHIYTVLSISVFAASVATAGNAITCKLVGYDYKGGTTAQIHYVFLQSMQNNQTFVWNDKFSFNGYEPVDFTGPLSTAVHQDAIADQGSSVAQKLYIQAEDGSDDFDITCTFIDQNNS